MRKRGIFSSGIDRSMKTEYGTPADEARLLYVAMTRSTDRLILSYHQELTFVKRFQPLI
jgi:superfamily I DNA/RNA helicase